MFSSMCNLIFLCAEGSRTNDYSMVSSSFPLPRNVLARQVEQVIAHTEVNLLLILKKSLSY